MQLALSISLILVGGLAALVGCTHRPVDKQKVLLYPIDSKAPTGALEPTGSMAESTAGLAWEGGHSDLFYSALESTPDQIILYTLTDRGPNDPKPQGLKRGFVRPEFQPQIIRLSLDPKTTKVQTTAKIGLVRPDGKSATGLPNEDGALSKKGFHETPVSMTGQALQFDPWGLDPEGLVQAPDGSFWIAEEYGPSLVQVRSDGRLVSRFLPLTKDTHGSLGRGERRVLPAFFSKRKANRGFEALAWTPRGTLLAFLQSEIPHHKPTNWAPILEFDPRTEKPVGLYFYPLDPHGGKIGAASLGADGRLFVVEQNGEIGETAWQKIFAIDLEAGTNTLTQALQADADWKIPATAKPVGKSLAVDLADQPTNRLEKIEGLSVLPDGRIVLVNDNDFGVAGGEGDRQNYLLVIDKEKVRSP